MVIDEADEFGDRKGERGTAKTPRVTSFPLAREKRVHATKDDASMTALEILASPRKPKAIGRPYSYRIGHVW